MPAADAFGPDVPVFRHLGRSPEQRRWLAALPAMVAGYEQRWQVRTGRPFGTGTSSWVAPGVTTDGRAVIMKIAWPHREARAEAAGLRHWAGHGAVRVHEADPARYAMLIERCVPGTPLAGAGMTPDAALAVGAGVLRRLWSVPAPTDATFEQVGAVTGEWAGLVRERLDRHRPPFDRGLVEHGAALLESLPRTATRTVLVHGDANPGNILAAGRQPWLAIDAKPMVGDPGYDPAPLLDQIDPPDTADQVRCRYRAFGDLVGEPAGRLLAWATARAVESALWHVSRDDLLSGATDLARAATLARAAGDG